MTPNSPLQRRVPPLALAILAVLIILIFLPVLVSAVRFDTDYLPHIKWAMGLSETGHFEKPIPQFLYHVSLIAVSLPIPISDSLTRFILAAYILGAALDVWIGLTIFYWLAPPFYQLTSRLRWAIPIALTLVIMLVSAVNLPTWANQNLYLGYLSANTYHNPTIIMLKPFALATFIFVLKVFDSPPASWKSIILSAFAAGLGTLAKPNYALALIPALFLLAAYALWRKRPIHWGLFAATLLPMVGVLAWQLLFYNSGISGGFEFAPLKVMTYYSPDGLLLPKFVLSILFPAAVYLLYFRQAVKRSDLNIAWLVFAIAVAYAYLLAESTGWQDGNFTWSTQITLFILFIVSVLFWVQQNLKVPQASRFKVGCCLLLLILHLVGGLALYVVHLTPVWVAWW